MMSEPILDRYGIPISFNNEFNRGYQPQQSRRASNGMTDDEQRERRASIKSIMADPALTPQERRLSIQALMDGRRRSSCCGSVCGGDISPVSPNERRGSYVAVSAPNHPGSQASFIANVDSSSLTEVQQAQAKVVQLSISTRMEMNRPPCTHYQRNCSIISPCCGMAFGCRICHDESPVLPPPFLLGDLQKVEGQKDMRYPRSSSMPTSVSTLPDSDNQHTIDRFKIAEIICRRCYTRQSSKTNRCINCHDQFGEYHCSTCNLWMSAEEEPYHCTDCGFCRVGGRDNFRHCHECGMCIDVLLFDEHDCKVGKYMSNCPVCQEDLFSSRAPSHEMPCGHAIHWHCFRELASYDSRCPICKKTAETSDRMASTWSAMAMGIALQPIPPEMAKVVDILCVDCEQSDEHRKWHFLGVQCRRCSSFNTVLERISLAGPDAATFLREHGDGAPRLPRISRDRAGLVGGVSSRSLHTRPVVREPSQTNGSDEFPSGLLMDFNSSSEFSTASFRGPEDMEF